jgi:hypothetical protein
MGGGIFRRFRWFSMGYTAMASNNKTTGKANKTAKVSTNKIAVDAVVPSQSEVISNLTALVKQLLNEITELKAAKANSEITVPAKPANKKIDIVSELKTAASEIAKTANKTKVNLVPANRFILLAENTTISELVSISSIGTPFSSKWGARQAVNCVTASGNTIVVFVNCVRDALGNTIPSGLIGGANYVLSGVASGKTSEFNGITSNIINKGKFSHA